MPRQRRGGDFVASIALLVFGLFSVINNVVTLFDLDAFLRQFAALYDIKDYNNSDLYALFIGQLADRYIGGGGFASGWSKVAAGFKRSDVLAIQKKLVAMGHDVGKADGLVGYKTRIAIGLWQRKSGLAETCYPDASVFAGLR